MREPSDIPAQIKIGTRLSFHFRYPWIYRQYAELHLLVRVGTVRAEIDAFHPEKNLIRRIVSTPSRDQRERSSWGKAPVNEPSVSFFPSTMPITSQGIKTTALPKPGAQLHPDHRRRTGACRRHGLEVALALPDRSPYRRLQNLALLKTDTTITAPLKLGVASPVTIGTDVFAIGTPKDIRLGQTVTKGIISAKRTIEGRSYIQSDVSVNRGNSGGALTNSKGELLGVVNSKMVGMGVEGLSFAIPVSYIEEALKIKLTY